MPTQIRASIDQDTRELVLDASQATGTETGQNYTVTLANRFGSVTVDQFEVEITDRTNAYEVIPGGIRILSTAPVRALTATAIPGGVRIEPA